MKNKNVWIVFKCIFELKIISKKFTIKLKDEKDKKNGILKMNTGLINIMNNREINQFKCYHLIFHTDQLNQIFFLLF